MGVWLGLDLGTGSSKAVAIDADGALIASAAADHATEHPEAGAYEQKPNKIRDAAFAALAEVAGALGNRAPTGLGLSGAMHTLLPVRGNAAAGPALTWADARCRGELAAIAREVDRAMLYQRTGCPLATPFHPARLRWLARTAPQRFREADAFVGLKDFVLHALTGLWATDYATASATGLFDIQRATWDERALAVAGIGAHRLPPTVEPATRVGGLSADAAAATGLPEGLPVCAGASDGVLANVGAGAHTERVVVSVGTTGAVRALCREPRLDPGRRSWCYRAFSDAYLAGGAINNGGLALEWAARALAPERGVDAVFRLAAEAAAGAEGVLFLPYLTGERTPHWESALSGGFVGLRPDHGRAVMARAVLEGVAYALADARAAVPLPGEALGRPPLLTGGIVQSPTWRRVVADVLGMGLVPVEAADASAWGAALLAQQARSGEPVPAPGTDAAETVEPDLERHHAIYGPGLERFRAAADRARAAVESP